MTRRPDEIANPNGYPYRLYEINNKYIIAVSKEIAIKKTGFKGKRKFVKPVVVHDLIEANGHSKTAQILRNYGKTWICKEGKVFYSNG